MDDNILNAQIEIYKCMLKLLIDLNAPTEDILECSQMLDKIIVKKTRNIMNKT